MDNVPTRPGTVTFAALVSGLGGAWTFITTTQWFLGDQLFTSTAFTVVLGLLALTGLVRLVLGASLYHVTPLARPVGMAVLGFTAVLYAIEIALGGGDLARLMLVANVAAVGALAVSGDAFETRQPGVDDARTGAGAGSGGEAE